MSPRALPLALALSLLSLAPLGAEPTVENRVTVPAMPTDLPGFLALRDQLAGTPQGGAVVFLVAAHLYSRDEALGLKAFTIAMHRKLIQKTGKGYKGWEPSSSFQSWVKKIKQQPYGPASYVSGATPENGYALPSGPLHYETFENPYSRMADGSVKVFVRTSGADNPRPYTVKANSRGRWKVSGGESSIYMGIRPPVVVDDGDDL